MNAGSLRDGRGYKLALLASLYLAQGLPFGFFTQALPVLMRDAGHSLKAISATAFLFLPWALKFLWAPLVDHVGSRKAWLMALQLSTLAGAIALSFIDLDRGLNGGLSLIFVALLLFNLLAAMQDVATDGLAVRMLSHSERGLGNGIQVGAYRIGMILGGGGLLWVFASAGWTVMLWCMAAILFFTCLPALFLPREPSLPASSRTLATGWIARLRVPGMLGFVGLICAYKFGDAMASSVVGPFMRDAGLSIETIAVVKGTIGSVMGLAGAAAGGWAAFRLGRRRALIGCGVLQTLSLLLYLACALRPGEGWLIYFASTAEHLLGGMATVALFTLMMDSADPDHASTDYTLLACAIVVAGGAAGFVAAAIGDAFGYAAVFALSFAVSGAGCALLVVALDRGGGPRRLAQSWAGRGGMDNVLAGNSP